MIQKNWTTTRFLRDAFENLSEKKTIRFDRDWWSHMKPTRIIPISNLTLTLTLTPKQRYLKFL